MIRLSKPELDFNELIPEQEVTLSHQLKKPTTTEDLARYCECAVPSFNSLHRQRSKCKRTTNIQRFHRDTERDYQKDILEN